MSQMLFVRLREPGDESPIFRAPTGPAPVFSGAAAVSTPPDNALRVDTQAILIDGQPIIVS